MVRGSSKEGTEDQGTTRVPGTSSFEAPGYALAAVERGFGGTDLVRLGNRTPTLKEKVAEIRANKQPWFQAAVIQYLGNKKWRLGLVPTNGERAQWLEGLPYEEIVKRIENLEGRIKRVDHTSKEYRNYD